MFSSVNGDCPEAASRGCPISLWGSLCHDTWPCPACPWAGGEVSPPFSVQPWPCSQDALENSLGSFQLSGYNFRRQVPLFTFLALRETQRLHLPSWGEGLLPWWLPFLWPRHPHRTTASVCLTRQRTGAAGDPRFWLFPLFLQTLISKVKGFSRLKRSSGSIVLTRGRQNV